MEVNLNTGSEDFHSRKRNYSEDDCGSDRDDLCSDDPFPEETDCEQKVSKAEPEMDINSNPVLDFRSVNWYHVTEWSEDESSCDRNDLYCDDLFPEETDFEQEVSKEDPKMDKNSYTMSAFHECTSNRDNLCYDDIFPEETENKHEVLADNQGGYDIQCSKTKREKAKEEAPPEEELLVDFTGLQSENLLKSPLPASNLKDPLCERSATAVHQAGSSKQNGVRNTILDEVNATTDEHFSSITSDASFRTVPKYQLKEEKVPQIGQETHRLAILRLDLSQVPAVDLLGGMCYFLPVGAQIKSVAVYSTRKHVKEDGLAGLFDDKVDELHKVQMLPSEESRQRYYGVVECDSTSTLSYLGVTPKMMELRFILDQEEFDDHLHDIVTEEPTTYKGLDLVQLLSAEDLKQITIVPEYSTPKLPWDGYPPRSFPGLSSHMWADSGLNGSSSDISDDDLYCDDLFLGETENKQEVSNTEPQLDKNSETTSDISDDSLYCDDLFLGETENEQEVSNTERELIKSPTECWTIIQ